MNSPLTRAFHQFDAIEANLAKLDRFWKAAKALFCAAFSPGNFISFVRLSQLPRVTPPPLQLSSYPSDGSVLHSERSFAATSSISASISLCAR